MVKEREFFLKLKTRNHLNKKKIDILLLNYTYQLYLE